MSKDISRRDLLKGMAAGAAGAVTLGILGACSGESQAASPSPSVSPSPSASPSASPAPSSAPAAPALYKAGTYSSVQKSAYATVEVTCTYSETALTDVSYQVLHSAGSDYFTPFASPLGDYCKRIVENGKADGVDAVAGASISSTAIRDGVNACTAQALGLSTDPGLFVLNPQDENFDSFDGDLDAVFTPVKLGSMELPNRVIKSAGSGPWEDANDDNIPVAAEEYGTMAENGVPLVLVSGDVVLASGLIPDYLGRLGDLDAALSNCAPVIERIHAAGGKIGYQLCYGGLAPTVPDAMINESSKEDLDLYIDLVGFVAERAKQVGIDCIEIKGASADGLNGFLTRRVNKREDEYGPQSFENRTRFFRRFIEKIKEVNGKDFPVGVLINAVEENDLNLGDNSLYLTIEESKEIAKLLVSAGADWIQLRVGASGMEMNIWAPDVQHLVHHADGITGYGNMFDYSTHYDGMMDGSHSGFAALLPMVKAIKEVVNVPVGCAAYTDLRVGPDYLNEAIKRGDIDLIFMNRPLTVDPEMVRKMKEHRREDVRPCMKCMHCHDWICSPFGFDSTCRMNAASYHSLRNEMPEGAIPLPTQARKKVMVIGAGPAGMECAKVAAERGHSVSIYDSADKLGGLMQFARGVKGPHERFDDYFAYMAYQLEKGGVAVNLRTTVDLKKVQEEKPDIVVVAVGAKRESKLSGEKVFSPEAAFGSQKLGEHVALLGANVQAIDFAAHLVTHGKRVTIIHDKTEQWIDAGQSGWFRLYNLPYIYSKGGKIWNNATVKGFDGKAVIIITETGLERVIPCDSVVDFNIAPNLDLAKEIETAGFQVHSVGDCAKPWNIQEAVLTGNLTARAL